jgi:hypothetical protein
MKVPRLKLVPLKDAKSPQAKSENERPRFLIKLLMEDPPYDVTEWEESFIESLAEKLERDPNYIFSEKQIEVLERIWAK